MAQRLAGAQARLFVQDALQEGLGIQQALHVHVGLAVMGQLHGLQRRGGLVRLVDDAVVAQVHVQLGGDLADGGLVAHQDRVGNAPLVGLVHRFQHGVVLGRGHGQPLFAAGTHFCNQVIKIHRTAPRSFKRSWQRFGWALTKAHTC